MTEISLRDQLAWNLGSLRMHDDDRGPDNTVLVDLLPFTPGEDTAGETMLYRIVDAILALPALASAQARIGVLEGALRDEVAWHQAEGKALRKAPKINDGGWRSASHHLREEILLEALRPSPEGEQP